MFCSSPPKSLQTNIDIPDSYTGRAQVHTNLSQCHRKVESSILGSSEMIQ